MTNRRVAVWMAGLIGVLLVALAALAAPPADDESELPVLGAEELQRMTPEQLERYSRGDDRQREAKIKNEFRTLLDQAVAAHAEGGVVVPEQRMFGQLITKAELVEMAKAPAPKGFEAWELGKDSGLKWQLHRSAALEDFVDKRWDEYLNSQPAERERIIARGESLASYAGPYLNDSDAAHRAVACEWLAHFPLETIHQGLLRQIADLMRDDSVAFQGTKLIEQLPPEDKRRYHLGEASVGEIAKLSVERILGIRFSNIENFERWWKDNSNYQERMWYWRVRAHNFASGAPLETMPPGHALKLILLSANESAAELEAFASWPKEQRVAANPPLKLLAWGGGGYPIDLAHFVRVHKLQPELVRIIEHEVDWPVVPDEAVLQSLPQILLPEDLPLLLKLLDDSKGALAPKKVATHWSVGEVVVHRTRLVRLAVEFAPDRAEEILVAELKRPASGCLPGVDLMAISGLAHWDLIKAAAVRDTFRGNVHPLILALADMKTPAARRALGELLVSLHIETFEKPKYYSDAETAVQKLLVNFANAAEALNGSPVVTKEQLARAEILNSARGKGAKPIPKEVAHNREVPQARREIVEQLSEFFAREM